MSILLYFLAFPLLVAQDRPVIRLDEIYIEGSVRKPPVMEIQASKLNEKVEHAALSSLIRLEKQLLTPLTDEDYRRMQNSAK